MYLRWSNSQYRESYIHCSSSACVKGVIFYYGMQKVFKQTSFALNYQELHRSCEESAEINGICQQSMWCRQLFQVLKFFPCPHCLQYFGSPGIPLFLGVGGGEGMRCLGFVHLFVWTLRLTLLGFPPRLNNISSSLLPERWCKIIYNYFWSLTPRHLSSWKKDLQITCFNLMTRNAPCL